tara:strand:+ start:220 stop:465 length:246 start_codon:yes stop_codon:yes gene_type:complete
MSDSILKSVVFTVDEHNLVFNLLQDHLEDIMQDEFFHIHNHDQAERATQLTVDALRSMKNYNPDMTAEEVFGDGSAMGLTA